VANQVRVTEKAGLGGEHECRGTWTRWAKSEQFPSMSGREHERISGVQETGLWGEVA
jgi:hypothetical protein